MLNYRPKKYRTHFYLSKPFGNKPYDIKDIINVFKNNENATNNNNKCMISSSREKTEYNIETFFCDHCKETSYCYNAKYLKKCPNCGKEVLSNEIFCGSANKIESKCVLESLFCEKVNDKKIRIHLEYIEPTFFNKKLQKRRFNVVVTYNLETGKSHILKALYSGTNKQVAGLNEHIITHTFSYAGNRLYIPYFNRALTEEECAYISSFFEKSFTDITGFNYKINPNLIMHRFTILSAINRFPLLDVNLVQDMLDDASNNKYMMKKLYKINNKSNINEVLKVFDIPDTKFFRGLFCQNPKGLIVANKIFKDRNIIKKFVEFDNSHSYNIGGFSSILLKDYKNIKFIQKFTKHMSENTLLNKIMSSTKDIFADTISMYCQIKKYNNDYEPRYDLSFRQLHDLLILDMKFVKTKNKPIDYVKTVFEELEFEKNNYKFVLPKETHDIIRNGSELDICVGFSSYIEEVLSGNIAIVFLYKNEQLFSCISVNKKLKNKKELYLSQVKKYKNRLTEGEDKCAVIEWAKIKNIEYENCYDLKERVSRIEYN